MNKSTEDRRHLLRMEGILGGLLRYGALVASGWMALGMALSLFKDVLPLIRLSDRCLAAGIVLLIALPVLRVALMAGVFLLEKDYRFAAISCAVLGIIALGFLLGTINPHLQIH
jgi:Protein of unknown function (DUF1634)